MLRQVLPKIESEANTLNYGRYAIGPMARGYGVTIGIALRRVLLGMDDLPHEDKLGSLADAVVGDTDKGEARKILSRLESLTAAVKLRLEGMK